MKNNKKTNAQKLKPLLKGSSKKQLGKSAIRMLMDTAAGFLGAGTAALIGNQGVSAAIGITTNGSGHYFDIPILKSFGVGLAVGPTFAGTKSGGNTTRSATGDQTSSASDRLKAFGSYIKEKFFLDKLGKSTDELPPDNITISEASGETVSGLGMLDMTSLDLIEQGVVADAMTFSGQSEVSEFDNAETIDFDHI